MSRVRRHARRAAHPRRRPGLTKDPLLPPLASRRVGGLGQLGVPLHGFSLLGDLPGCAVILGDEDANEDNESKWRILILEDTGELLAADAKAQAGQGLSRLLNVVDGIIGQGLRVLVLVTTNDELHQLHPAVARPGRCLAIAIV